MNHSQMNGIKEYHKQEAQRQADNAAYTGLRYRQDCGWYAVVNGVIVCDWSMGISGTKASAEMDLAAATKTAEKWAAIDWAAVEPLEADERCTFENPDYLYILF